jgi:photosystem II stability/assembly factor-like uncharacterized protein
MANPDRIVLGTRKGLLLLERGGGGWRIVREAHAGIPVPYAAFDPRTGTLWASLDHGHWGQKLQRSTDGGETWEELEAPAYPEGDRIKEGVPAVLRYLWVLAPGGDDEPDRLYAGTEPGGLFRSDDGGRSFSLVRSLWDHPSRSTSWFGGGRDHAGIHSVWVDPRDSRRVLVGVSVAGVFESTDGGETWEPRNRGLVADFLPDPRAEVGHDPHLLVACRANPDVLWQQNHCGIFRSEDGTATWTDVSEKEGPARFGFAIAADPERPGTAWVVPAVADEMRVAVDRALCVCRTEDGGASWTAFRDGLPQEGCYDIVYRHALDLAGDRLAFGSTTGNVWISDDRGESWSAVTNHLPLVYSVRFGL